MFIAFARGEASLEAVAAEQPAISVITVSELLQGPLRGPAEHRTRRRAIAEQILEPFEAIRITSGVARRHAEMWVELVATGTMIGLHDSWIGATALTYDLGVATRNPRDFKRIPGLRVLAA